MKRFLLICICTTDETDIICTVNICKLVGVHVWLCVCVCECACECAHVCVCVVMCGCVCVCMCLCVCGVGNLTAHLKPYSLAR